jgi:3-oxocholest-4-en-26-oate---CoA ligase
MLPTFIEFGGRPWALPGDMATVDADGTIRLLGRGSLCVNTGGEKVYPEEVEAVFKSQTPRRIQGPPPRRRGARDPAISLREGRLLLG